MNASLPKDGSTPSLEIRNSRKNPQEGGFHSVSTQVIHSEPIIFYQTPLGSLPQFWDPFYKPNAFHLKQPFSLVLEKMGVRVWLKDRP